MKAKNAKFVTEGGLLCPSNLFMKTWVTAEYPNGEKIHIYFKKNKKKYL